MRLPEEEILHGVRHWPVALQRTRLTGGDTRKDDEAHRVAVERKQHLLLQRAELIAAWRCAKVWYEATRPGEVQQWLPKLDLKAYRPRYDGLF